MTGPQLIVSPTVSSLHCLVCKKNNLVKLFYITDEETGQSERDFFNMYLFYHKIKRSHFFFFQNLNSSIINTNSTLYKVDKRRVLLYS